MKRSEFLKLNKRDFVKGLILAIVSAGLTVLQTSLQAGSLEVDWKLMLTVSLAAGVAYLGKNLFETPNS